MAAGRRGVTLQGAVSAEPREGAPSVPPLEWLAAASRDADEKRARLENFPVASRLLPAALRVDLFALYAVARLVDEAGDEFPGTAQERIAVLDLIDADLTRLETSGTAEIAAVRDLRPAVARGLSVAPFHNLVEANRRDQHIARYATFADLRDYCRYSADPIGRLVLSLLRLSTARRVSLSDDICTALQIAEHLQDVGEDLRAGRIYLPQDSLARFDVTEATLAALANPVTAPGVPGADRARVSALLAAEAGRARDLLEAGAPLIGLVPGRARLAIAGFVAGGHAALDAVTSAGASAVTLSPPPRPTRVLRHAVVGLATGGIR
jgi:squalene synthase HpnC